MSSPAQSGPSAPSKEKTGVSRMLTRMKTIMKRAEKRMSVSGSSKATPSPAKPAFVYTHHSLIYNTMPPSTSQHANMISSAEPAAASEAGPSGSAADKPKAKKTGPAYPNATRVPRIQLHEERARKLGERFGLEILPSEWHSTEGDALRVNKPIRMRVHRTCHECNTDFGTAKQCPKCDHVRCTQCARYPPKRTEAEKQAARERRAQVIREQKEHAPIIADWDDAPKKVYILSRPSRSGGQDLVYKKPRQRLRRNCCQCNKLFVSGNKTCPACTHVRCTDCPRDPYVDRTARFEPCLPKYLILTHAQSQEGQIPIRIPRRCIRRAIHSPIQVSPVQGKVPVGGPGGDCMHTVFTRALCRLSSSEAAARRTRTRPGDSEDDRSPSGSTENRVIVCFLAF